MATKPTDKRFIDLTGVRFGKLTVLEFSGNRHWLCKCECGTEKKMYASNLASGKSTTCGCRTGSVDPRFVDLYGLVFGRWTVVEFAGQNSAGSRWLCRCDCGTERTVYGNSLSGGRSESCGCKTGDRMRTHGSSHSIIYASWKSMIDRCHNPDAPNYRRYGGRGITVCKEWRESIQVFARDMGTRPSRKYSIHRVKNHLGYFPGNCVWATPKTQSRNRCDNRMLTCDGKTMCLSDWADELGVPHYVFRARLRYGWSHEQTLKTPYQPRSARKK